MGIDSRKEVEEFGDAEILTSSSALLANAAMSIDSDTITWYNKYGVDVATIILTFTPSAITTATDSIKLYASRNEIDGVVSENFPSINFKQKLLGEFFVDASAAIQSVATEIFLDNCKSSQQFEFAIENLLTTVNINAGWVLTIIPKAKGTR